jgi:hypothetical protein
MEHLYASIIRTFAIFLVVKHLKSLVFFSPTPVAGVLEEPYSQLSRLSGVAVQARQSS